MTFTYDPTSTDVLHEVRRLVGDTDSYLYSHSDEDINREISRLGNSPKAVAVALLKYELSRVNRTASYESQPGLTRTIDATELKKLIHRYSREIGQGIGISSFSR